MRVPGQSPCGLALKRVPGSSLANAVFKRFAAQSSSSPVFKRFPAWSCIFSMLQKFLAKTAKKIKKFCKKNGHRAPALYLSGFQAHKKI